MAQERSRPLVRTELIIWSDDEGRIEQYGCSISRWDSSVNEYRPQSIWTTTGPPMDGTEASRVLHAALDNFGENLLL